jgi:hypothetical protein
MNPEPLIFWLIVLTVCAAVVWHALKWAAARLIAFLNHVLMGWGL